MNPEQLKPPFTLPTAPAGVPEWAFLQVKDLGHAQRPHQLVHRQPPDLRRRVRRRPLRRHRLPQLVARPRLHGSQPRQAQALAAQNTLDTIYANDMFDQRPRQPPSTTSCTATRTASTSSARRCMIDFGSPKQLERAMESPPSASSGSPASTSAGQRQVRSAYYSGTKMAENGVWGWGKGRSYMVFHPALQLVLFNGTPADPQDGHRDRRRLPRPPPQRRERQIRHALRRQLPHQ